MERRRSLIPSFLASRQTLICIIALVVIFIPRESGLGIELCLLKNATGAPCPGCGVTRSCANLVHGNVGRSLQYHPLGVVFTPVLFGIVVLSLLPGSLRRALADRLSRRQRALHWVIVVFWTVFFTYGLVRWVAVMTHLISFPPPM